MRCLLLLLVLVELVASRDSFSLDLQKKSSTASEAVEILSLVNDIGKVSKILA